MASMAKEKAAGHQALDDGQDRTLSVLNGHSFNNFANLLFFLVEAATACALLPSTHTKFSIKFHKYLILRTKMVGLRKY